MTATSRSVELRTIAQRIAAALPMDVAEVVLTASVSRGVADDISDIEMLIVTENDLDVTDCFTLAAACGLTDLGTWGRQDVPTKRVSGYSDGAPVELIWWSRAYAQTAVDAIFTSDLSATADAIASGVALRTSGQLVRWQERLRHYPNDLASTRIEDAALKWGGFHAAGLLTLLRPGERLALLEWIVDDAARVVRIIFALNCVWQPTSKRARRSDRSIAPQACRSGRADRGGATGIRSPPCAPHHDCTSVGNARTRARRAERQPGESGSEKANRSWFSCLPTTERGQGALRNARPADDLWPTIAYARVG